jgi:hypothetical protein
MAWNLGRCTVYAERGFLERTPHIRRLRRQWGDVYEVGAFGFRLSVYRFR